MPPTVYFIHKARIAGIGLILALTAMFFQPQQATAQSVDTLGATARIDSLIKVSRALTSARKFSDALLMNDKADSMALAIYGERSVTYGKCTFNRGRIHYLRGTHSDAEKWCRLSVEIRKEVLGSSHEDLAWSMNNLALVLRAQARYSEAEPLFREVVDVVERVFGNRHIEFASAQSNLGTLYLSMGEYAKAEPLFLNAYVLRDSLMGRESMEFAASQNNLAILYMELGRYQEAEPIYLDALAFRERKQGKQSSDYITALNNLAILYARMSLPEKAEPLYLEALELRERFQGRESREFASELNNLGALYLKMRRNKQAESHLLEALAIRKRLLGNEHPDYANSLNNLAFCYLDLGAFAKAEACFLEALRIKQLTLTPDHPNMGIIYHNLGEANMRMGRNGEAENYTVKALGVWDNSLGSAHGDYGSALSNLALIKMEQGKFEESEALVLKARELLVSVYGEQHSEVAINYQTAGLLYFRKGMMDRAEHYLEQALAIHAAVDGKAHPSYLFALRNLAVAYSRGSRYADAVPMLEELFVMDKRRLDEAMTFLSEGELEEFYQMFRQRARNSADILYRLQKKGKGEVGFSGLAFDQTLFYKGFLLDVSLEMKKRARTDTASAAVYSELVDLKGRLSNEWAEADSDRGLTVMLQARADSLEKILARNIMGLERVRRDVRWKELRDSLQADEAVLEFFHSQPGGPDSIRGFLYSAFLLTSDSRYPVFIPLFREKDLEELGSLAADPEGYLTRVYGCAGCPAASAKTGALYHMVWEPILKKVSKKIKRIHFAPSGALYQFNLTAVADGEGAVISDRFELSLLGSTKDLVLSRKVDNAGPGAAVFGGIRFDAPVEFGRSPDLSKAKAKEQYAVRSGSSPQDWNYLPWTLAEAETAHEILADKGVASRLYTGAEATEEAFKALAAREGEQTGILHLATHGYFIAEKGGEPANEFNFPVAALSSNRMLRSGLILAGGNQAWISGIPIGQGLEDGVLTAYEISQMEFRGLELAVLSACETGLGENPGYEGVYGLQRAFRLAGARYIIMSLWQVPDWETMAFMTAFYKHLEFGDSFGVKQAFLTAQREVRQLFPEPRKWAGFVLLE